MGRALRKVQDFLSDFVPQLLSLVLFFGGEFPAFDFFLEDPVGGASFLDFNDFRIRLFEVGYPHAGNQRNFHLLASGKNGLEREIITLGNGIKLVVVAARATHGQTHEHGGGGVRPIGPLFITQLLGIHV